ncbi:unnamed protein product [Rhizophagus irregularis]|nr:unnamed protein product [Rhizophagus irregularis]
MIFYFKRVKYFIKRIWKTKFRNFSRLGFQLERMASQDEISIRERLPGPFKMKLRMASWTFQDEIGAREWLPAFFKTKLAQENGYLHE